METGVATRPICCQVQQEHPVFDVGDLDAWPERGCSVDVSTYDLDRLPRQLDLTSTESTCVLIGHETMLADLLHPLGGVLGEAVARIRRRGRPGGEACGAILPGMTWWP